MTDEIGLQRKISRGQKAKALIEDEVLNEAFNTLEKSYLDFWRTTDVKDFRAREAIFIAVNQVEKLKSHLHAVLSDGKIADIELQRAFSDQERKKKLGGV